MKEEWDETSLGSHDGDMITQRGTRQHRLSRERVPGTCLQQVVPKQGNRHGFIHAQISRAFKQQLFNVALSVLPCRPEGVELKCGHGGKTFERGRSIAPSQQL